MRHGSLFSGIGGFDLAAEWMGWENIFHCEWNEFGQKVLKHYWPKAETFTDITKSDFTKYANKIDILTGGFPCQPYSTAGKRLGTEDDRHLWPEMLRAIREISPRWIVGENVRGLTNWNGGMVFDEVQADLEAEGYEVLPFLLPACAVNAPHRRDRIWFISFNPNSRTVARDRTKQEVFKPHQITHTIGTRPANAAHGNSAGLQAERPEQQATGIEQYGELGGNVTNASGEGLEGGGRQWSGFEPFGRDRNWERFPTQSPLCNGNDGLPARLDTNALSFSKWRNESIKAGGNAIVPQVALQLFKAIEAYEMLNSEQEVKECDTTKAEQ
jgi:DNA (cytosine-5)-methyltransferase 1